ncbi:MAG: PilZ domain-containing protein [Novosphingobium sp.]|nr:PilZ domain-containing protein [Novosphingobium sp.]
MFAGARRSEALIVDISQHGACIVSDEYLAIDERIRIKGDSLPELTARVRWRRRPLYGLIFEQTFRFDDLARLAARLTTASASPMAAVEWDSALRRATSAGLTDR